MARSPGKRPASRLRRLWRFAQQAFALVIVGAIFLAVLPQITSYRSVWERVSSISAAALLLLAIVVAINLTTYWVQSMAAMPGLTLRMAIVENQTTTTIANTIPGGGAIAVGVSLGIFGSWGYTEGDVGRFTDGGPRDRREPARGPRHPCGRRQSRARAVGLPRGGNVADARVAGGGAPLAFHARALFEQAAAHRGSHSCGPVRHAELLVEALEVRLHGGARDEQARHVHVSEGGCFP